MNLRHLFNPTRFAGCVNGRLELPLFRKPDAAPLQNLFCQELPNGNACLMLNRGGRFMAPQQLDLPDYLRGRIDFWNKWASYALEYEYEITPSLYGLEAYGISVAMELAALCPDYRTTYGGLPINAEQTLTAYLMSFDTCAEWWHNIPPAPVDVQNPYMKRLLASTEPVTQRSNAHIFTGWADDDFADLYFTTYGTADSGTFYIEEAEGFPAWLAQQMEDRELIWMWRLRDTLLTPFWEDALSVDITRFARPLLPVSFTDRYITGEDVLAVCRAD